MQKAHCTLVDRMVITHDKDKTATEKTLEKHKKKGWESSNKLPFNQLVIQNIFCYTKQEKSVHVHLCNNITVAINYYAAMIAQV